MTTATAEPEPVRLSPGDAAPAFTLQDQQGRTVQLAEYRGRRIVLFAYPAALTPACSAEALRMAASSAPLAPPVEKLTL